MRKWYHYLLPPVGLITREAQYRMITVALLPTAVEHWYTRGRRFA